MTMPEIRGELRKRGLETLGGPPSCPEPASRGDPLFRGSIRGRSPCASRPEFHTCLEGRSECTARLIAAREQERRGGQEAAEVGAAGVFSGEMVYLRPIPCM